MNRLNTMARLVGGRAGIAVAVVAVAVLTVAFVSSLARAREDAIAKAQHEMTVIADALEVHARALFRTNTVALEAMADELHEPHHSETESRQLLRRMADTLGNGSDAALIAADGTLRYAARHTGMEGTSALETPYFRHHADNAALEARIGAPAPPHDDAFTITRRLETKHGAFAGVALISLSPTFFNAFYRTLEMGDSGHLMLLTADGALLAREPHHGVAPGDRLPLRRIFSGMADGRLGDTELVVSPLDGVRRIAAYRRLPDLDLVVVAGTSLDEALTDWRGAALAQTAMALPTFVILLAVLTALAVQNRAIRASEAAARASEERVRLITGALPGVVFQFRVGPAGDWSFPFISPQIEGLYGFPPETVYQDPAVMFRAIVQDDVPALMASIEASHASLTPWSQQWRLRRDDGVRHLRGQSVPRRRADGSVVWDGILVDVTELVEARDALNAERALFGGGPVVVFKWSAEPGWPVEYVSPNVETSLGYPAPALLGGNVAFAELVFPDDLERVTREIAGHVADGRTSFEQEYRIRHADGRPRWVYDFTIVGRDAAGTASYFLGYLLDITERKEMEEQIGAERDFIRAVINSLPGVFYVIRPDGGFEMVNDTLVRVAGRTPDTLIAVGPLACIAPQDRAAVAAAIRRAFDEGAAEVEASLLTADDRELPYYFTGARFVGARGPRLVGMGLELTARKQMEEAIRKSNEELESFAYIASHDLQEPLRTITTFLQLLKREYGAGLDEDATTYIDFAVDGALRMSHLIRDLLQYSRAGRARVGTAQADLSEAFDGALALLGQSVAEAGAKVTADPLPVVTGDVDQLARLLQNLIGNAIKYRAKDRPAHIHVSADRQGEAWLVSVADNGIGIDPQYHDKIFQVFQRLHGRSEYEGTGIGLAVCKKIVEAHGGTITVDSTPGEGSAFRFTLKPAEVEAAVAQV